MSQLPTLFFFFNDTATTEIYTLSLHDALPISPSNPLLNVVDIRAAAAAAHEVGAIVVDLRSEEHTSELQSPCNLVCRLLLEKKKKHPRLRHYLTTFMRHAPERRRTRHSATARV